MTIGMSLVPHTVCTLLLNCDQSSPLTMPQCVSGCHSDGIPDALWHSGDHPRFGNATSAGLSIGIAEPPESIGFINPFRWPRKLPDRSRMIQYCRWSRKCEETEGMLTHTQWWARSSEHLRDVERYVHRCDNEIKKGERKEQEERLHNTIPLSGFERTQWYGCDWPATSPYPLAPDSIWSKWILGNATRGHN